MAASVLLLLRIAHAQDTNADRWKIMAEINNLDGEGKTPFHLTIAFQLFDLEGVPKDTGTIDEWWADSHHHHIVISTPTLNAVTDQLHPSQAALRERYLANQLLAAAVHPVRALNTSVERILKQEPKKFGKVTLQCATVMEPVTVPGFLPCTAPGVAVVQLLQMPIDGGDIGILTRNALGTFHNTYASLDLALSFLGRIAITGKVMTLQHLDEQKIDELTSKPPLESSDELNAETVPGKAVKQTPPSYPIGLEQASGNVLLYATITRDGTMQNLAPIASTSVLFTESAMNAVKSWKFEPSRTNGTPRNVNTAIVVIFRPHP